jgi:uncharacterized protein (UPF0335 family)
MPATRVAEVAILEAITPICGADVVEPFDTAHTKVKLNHSQLYTVFNKKARNIRLNFIHSFFRASCICRSARAKSAPEYLEDFKLRRMTMADVGGIAADRLRSFIERIERLEEERKSLGADLRDVYSEAKSAGFDTKIMRQIVRIRKLDSADRQEQEELIDLYKQALGM